MLLPQARGPLSEAIGAALRRPLHGFTAPVPNAPLLTDDDAQLGLFLCYQLHYHGFDDVDDDWEWQPELLAIRAGLEAEFEHELRMLCPVDATVLPSGVPAA